MVAYNWSVHCTPTTHPKLVHHHALNCLRYLLICLISRGACKMLCRLFGVGKNVLEAELPEVVVIVLKDNAANQDKSSTKLDESVGKENKLQGEIEDESKEVDRKPHAAENKELSQSQPQQGQSHMNFSSLASDSVCIEEPTQHHHCQWAKKGACTSCGGGIARGEKDSFDMRANHFNKGHSSEAGKQESKMDKIWRQCLYQATSSISRER
eukprot:13270021-Ditylum_brightwellii.AAC.1